MGHCYDRVEQSFFFRKILTAILILFNIGLTIYFIISNAQSYNKYKNRSSYKIFRISNTTSDYYIIREHLNDTLNCSDNALFTFDVTTVFENIISKEGARNILFIIVYWLSTIVAMLLSLFDIITATGKFCRKEEDEYDQLGTNDQFFYKLIRSIGSQFLQKGSFLFPTYFIGIFDYTQLCLLHHTEESLFLLHHTYIGILISFFSMIYLLLWTWACWDSTTHEIEDVRWVKYIEILTCGNSIAFVIVLIVLCLAVIPIGVYGMFVWITSLMEFILTTKAVLICFNFFGGLLNDLAHFCRHC